MTSEEQIESGRRLGLKYGHIQGLRNVASGHLDSIRKLVHAIQKRNGHLAKIQSLGGKIQGPVLGRIAVESGQLERIRTREHQQYAAHCRWHSERSNPKCSFCFPPPTVVVAA